MVQCDTNKMPDWKVTILVNQQKTCFKIDTGALCNVIARLKYHKLCSKPLQVGVKRILNFRYSNILQINERINELFFKNFLNN